MTIAAILAQKNAAIITMNADESVAAAVRVLADQRIGALPILEAGTIVGIFSERDVVYALGQFGSEAMTAKLGDVMTAPAVTVTPETGALAALSLMTRRRIRHLPVVERPVVERPVVERNTGSQSAEPRGNAPAQPLAGFVSIGDLVKYRIDRIEAEAAAMRDYIQGA